MIVFSDITKKRDNNLNLIRFLAATTVMYSHCYSLIYGNPSLEPLQRIADFTFGTVAVDIFFLISGFLITASILKRQSLLDFAFARMLRIYPALIISVLLTVYVLGACFTTLRVKEYYMNDLTIMYTVKNMTMILRSANFLPGVFENNPLKNSINGSLWTIPYELKLYLAIAMTWFFWRSLSKNHIKRFNISVLVLAVGGLIVLFVDKYWYKIINHYLRIFYMFFIGAAWYVLREKIRFSTKVFLIILVAITASAINKELFFAVYCILMPYVVFYIAFVPRGKVLAYNRIGDYSYGIYIYAFPIQQSVVALVPNLSIMRLFFLAFPITIVFAVLSWHILEYRALQFKKNPLPVENNRAHS